MRLTLWGIALLLSGMLVGVLIGHHLSRFDLPGRFAIRHHDRDRLDVRIERVDLQNVPFAQAIERLNQDSGANIGVNWRVLEAAGVHENTLIFVQTQNLPLRKVLDQVCAEAGAGAVKVGYRADDDGSVFLSTAEELAKETVVRIYDVRPL